MIHKTTRSILSVLLAALLLVASTPLTPAFAGGGGGAVSPQSANSERGGLEQDGDGTEGDPYKIATADDLLKFAQRVNGTDGNSADPGAHAKLMNDINLSEICGEEFDSSWTPIGNSSQQYRGTFDGAGYEISGLYIDSDATYAGLFGRIGTKGTVKNLTLTDSYINININSGNSTAYVGGICGYNDGTIQNCCNSVKATATVTGSSICVGGICGYNNYSGSITSCSNSGTVTGSGSSVTGSGSTANVGGICGENWGSIENCSNSGPVEGSGSIGGICGRNTGGRIENCSNSGDVSGTNVGGICGANNGTITNCSNSGPVTGSGEVGGICGKNWGGPSFIGSGSITNCYWLETAYIGEGVGVNEAEEMVTEVLSKNKEAYESGEVAWLLNQWQTDKPWGQGSNDRPILISNCPEGVTTKTPVRITIKIQNETTERYGYTTAGSTLASYPNDYMFFEDDQYSKVIDKATKTFDKDITIYAQAASSVTGIALNKTTLALYVNDTEQLTATVAPEGADGTILWTSSDSTVATVDRNGSVHAVGAGTANITVAAASDSSKNAACTVTVTESVYGITADTTTLNFGSVYTGYAQPAAQTVTLTNTGNRALTLNQPASTNSFEVGTLSEMELAVGETATFTVQPKAGLSASSYEENLTISGTGGTSASVALRFSVRERPYIPPTPPSVSEETIDAILDAEPGETVSVALKDGDTTLDAEVFETLAGQDITLEIALEGGVTWTVNGQDIPADANLDDLDLGVEMDSDGIPVDVVNSITGERDTVQMTLAHDGAFGFTMTLTAPLGAENAGYWANLYHYDEDAEQLTFETAAEIDADGSVTIPFSHASQYAIVIDTHSHATVDVSDLFIDIAPDAWYKDAIQYAYDNGLMTGVSATEFAPEATTTRAMIVSILARLENVTTAEAAGFADVDDNDWYATAVNWAANVGVVNGYEDGTFKPNTAITREQLAAILMNYAAYKGEDVSNRADLANYTDQPSAWATETMSWAVAEGLISGVTNTELQPQGNATRAQVAAILQRFLDK